MIRRIVADDNDAVVLLRDALKGKPGRPPKAEETRSNATGFQGQDRGIAYTLDRLAREAPELRARVDAGELSANKHP